MAKLAMSWVAVNKSGDVCLDADPSPLPTGWERCLDLQSGVMYLKHCSTLEHGGGGGTVVGSGNGSIRGSAVKRRKLSFEFADGEGDPGLQLTLSLPAPASLDSSAAESRRLVRPLAEWLPPAKISPPLLSQAAAVPSPSPPSYQRPRRPKDAAGSNPSPPASGSHSLLANCFLSLSSSSPQSTPTKEVDQSRRGATTSSNGSSASCNASSSYSSSSSPSPSSKCKQFGVGSHGLRVNQVGLEEHNQERIPMKAAGCPHCFMYVLPSRSNPKCPRCRSHVLVDLSPLTTTH